MGKTPVTYFLLAVNICVFAVCFIAGRDAAAAFAAGGEAVFARGEVWRLLTSVFVHLSAGHIIFNSLSLYIFGARAEAAFGGVKFAALYLLSGVIGALASCVVYAGASAGASGAIFGAGGALAVYTKKYGAVGGVDFSVCAVLLIGNVIGGLATTGIANAAHIAGGLCGAVLALLFMGKRAWK